MNGNGNAEGESLSNSPVSEGIELIVNAKQSGKAVRTEGLDEDELLRDNENETHEKDLPGDLADINPQELLTDDEEESPEIEALTDDEIQIHPHPAGGFFKQYDEKNQPVPNEDEDESAVSRVEVDGDEVVHSGSENQDDDPLAQQSGDVSQDSHKEELSGDNCNLTAPDDNESKSQAADVAERMETDTDDTIKDSLENELGKDPANDKDKIMDTKKLKTNTESDSLDVGDSGPSSTNADQDKEDCDENESLKSESKEANNDPVNSDDEDDMPKIRMKSDIFEAQNDEEDDSEGEGMDPEALQGMMEVEMGEDDSGVINTSPIKQRKDSDVSQEKSPLRRNPPRKAAVVASNTIKEITTLEESTPDLIRKSKDDDDDVEYVETISTNLPSTATKTYKPSAPATKVAGSRHHCQQCKQTAPSLITVRQYGTDIHLCSNKCFNSFRNPDPAFRPLPCAKCGVLHRDNEKTQLYFWETMNFCSEVCVGNFQFKIGFYCSTCSKKTPWSCMGKYCVRFGSDIRQFCTATCLESYKRNARVCFHCQLDIKKLGNVVLANIPSKNTSKEFCSQECVEQYIDQNVPTVTRVKTTASVNCHVCKSYKIIHKELVTAIMSYKVCSGNCWDKLLKMQCIRTATKCEACTKFINMDTINLSPSFYVATQKKAFGFCSATCKNVFVLKTRQIRPCSTCQVKKYNYDLIQYQGGSSNFAVCSLNCFPNASSSTFILNLKRKISDPSYVPPSIRVQKENQVTTTPSTASSRQVQTTSSTQLTAVCSDGFTEGSAILEGQEETLAIEHEGQVIQIDDVSSLAESVCGVFLANNDGSFNYDAIDMSRFSVLEADGVTMRPATEKEIEEFRNFTYSQQDLAEATGEDLEAMDYAATTGTEMETEQEEGFEGCLEELEDDEEEEGLLEEIEKWACSEALTKEGWKNLVVQKPVEQRNKGCQVKPYRNEVETQTDIGELADMPRIEPKVRVLIVPIPVMIPFPVFTCEQPTPVPVIYPVGVPIPIPIPIIPDKPSTSENSTSTSTENLPSTSSSVKQSSTLPSVVEDSAEDIVGNSTLSISAVENSTLNSGESNNVLDALESLQSLINESVEINIKSPVKTIEEIDLESSLEELPSNSTEIESSQASAAAAKPVATIDNSESEFLQALVQPISNLDDIEMMDTSEPPPEVENIEVDSTELREENDDTDQVNSKNIGDKSEFIFSFSNS